MQCKQCQKTFEWTDADRALLTKLAPEIAGRKFELPPPLLCWDCHCQRVWCFRNQYSFYKRKSSLSGQEMISLYSPDKPDTVYTYDEWWGDSWSAADFGRDFDFSRPFFDQFDALLKAVPKMTLIQDGTSENCDYTNFGAENKNCYMATVYRSENVYYSQAFMSKDCLDCYNVMQGERLYECIDCFSCYHSAYLQDCNQCSDSWFLDSCTNCKNCLGCKNLNNKEYYIFNKPCSKEEYEKRFAEMMSGEPRAFQKQFDAFRLTLPFRFAWLRQCDNSVGNLLTGCKNCYNCFDAPQGAEDCRHCLIIGARDALYSHNTSGELEYQTDGVLNASRVYFSHFMRHCSDSFYSMYCYNSKNLFGCTGLSRKEYCILNKQYSKEAYEALVPKIIEHMIKTEEWGGYFPAKLSPFGYSETLASEYTMLTKDEAVKQGFNWSDYQAEVKADRVIPASRLPDKITDSPDDVLNWAILCEATGKPFKIIPQELRFYREYDLPLPHRHPDVRRRDRVKKRPPYHLWKRQCAQCAAEIMTAYAPDRPEIVYCEPCYLGTIY